MNENAFVPPRLNYSLNILCRDKSIHTIQMWQKLCICYTVIKINKQVASEKKILTFQSLADCIKYFDEEMKVCAEKIITAYQDCIPVGLSVSDLCLKSNLVNPSSNKTEEEIDFYEFEFSQIKSQLSTTYFTLWNKIQSEQPEESVEMKLKEFRKRFHNRIRRQKLTKDFDESWFPLEWLCFLTFGLVPDLQVLLSTTDKNVKSFVEKGLLEDQISEPDASEVELENPNNNLHIDDFPQLNFPQNTVPRFFTKKLIKIWQRLCAAYSMMEYYRFKQASLIQNIDKVDFLSKSFRYYTKKLVQNYAMELPKGVTADILCQCQSELEIFGLPPKKDTVTYFNGQKIYRLWTDTTPQVNRYAMKAWEEVIVPMFSNEDFQNEKKIPLILSLLRKRWWELLHNAEQTVDSSLPYAKRQRSYDSSWFPSEWLTFVCFGPLSKNPFFTTSSSSSNTNTPKSCVAQNDSAKAVDKSCSVVGTKISGEKRKMESVLLEPSIGAINLIHQECEKSVINDDYDTVSTSSSTNSVKSVEPERKKQKLTPEENVILFPNVIYDSLHESPTKNPVTTLSYPKPLLEPLTISQTLHHLPINQPLPSPSLSTTTDDLPKEIQFTLVKEQHQLKSKELELIKILKLIDICSIPAFYHYSHSLNGQHASLNTTSNHSPIIPTSDMIYNDKLLKWIEALEAFQV